MATRLKDARLVVQLDTTDAQAKAQKLRKDKGRKDEQEERRTSKRREDRKKVGEKAREGRLAVIPAFGRQAGKMFSVIKAAIAFKAFEGVAGGIGGFIKEAGQGKGDIVEGVSDAIGGAFTEASRKLAQAQALIGSGLATANSAAEMASNMALLGFAPKDILEATKQFADRASFVGSSVALGEVEKRILTREAYGRAAARALEDTKKATLEGLGAGGNG